MSRLRRATQRDNKEIEFWSARELYQEFGYSKWDSFLEIIEKGKENCSKIQVEPRHHFAEVRKMIEIGKGAHREQIDFVLSRTACYLIALNADAGKTQIAWAKAYFIVQTRAQEVSKPIISDADERQRLRENLKKANLELGGAAKEAGVDNFGYFHAAGIRGLYGKSMSELKAKKGISQKDDYWDRVSGLELSANEFKAQLAKKTIAEKKKNGELNGQKQAEQEHERVGKTVRETVRKETGIFLENLQPEPSLKKLLSVQKKLSKTKAAIPAATIQIPDAAIE